MEYERTMSLKEMGAEGLLGKAAAVRLEQKVPSYDCIQITVNGTSLGVKAYAPYVWDCPKGLLKEEGNQIRVVITNTLANMLDGTYFDYDSHQLFAIMPEKGE